MLSSLVNTRHSGFGPPLIKQFLVAQIVVLNFHRLLTVSVSRASPAEHKGLPEQLGRKSHRIVRAGKVCHKAERKLLVSTLRQRVACGLSLLGLSSGLFFISFCLVKLSLLAVLVLKGIGPFFLSLRRFFLGGS